MYEQKFNIEKQGRLLIAKMIIPDEIDSILISKFFSRSKARSTEDFYEDIKKELETVLIFEQRTDWVDRETRIPVNNASFLAYRLGCHYNDDSPEDFVLLNVPKDYELLEDFQNYMDVPLELRGTRSEGNIRFASNRIFKTFMKQF